MKDYYYEEVLKLKDLHKKEVIFYSTIDNNFNDIIGIFITHPNIFDGVYNNYTANFSKEDIKLIINSLTERLEELEKPKQEETLTGDEIIRDLENNIYNLQDRMENKIYNLQDRVSKLERTLSYLFEKI